MDLNEYLIRHPAATFFVRAVGDSMVAAGINSQDILVVDRSIPAQDGDIVLAVLDGEFTVKRLRNKGGVVALHPENPKYDPIYLSEGASFEVWGTVTFVIHATK